MNAILFTRLIYLYCLLVKVFATDLPPRHQKCFSFNIIYICFMRKVLIFLSLFLFALPPINKLFAQSQIVLEHTFEGYYYPYNFPVYNEVNDEKCFYPAISQIDGNSVSFIIYNEDYTIKENYNVSFPIPQTYKPQAISFSNTLKLADGTPFFLVVFISEILSAGQENYAIAQMFNARTGNLLSNLGTSTLSITPYTVIYLINGKPTILMLSAEYNADYGPSYRTFVYSLGTPETAIVNTYETDTKPVQPIITFDIKGRMISQPIQGQSVIEVFSDGSSRKVIIN